MAPTLSPGVSGRWAPPGLDGVVLRCDEPELPWLIVVSLLLCLWWGASYEVEHWQGAPPRRVS